MVKHMAPLIGQNMHGSVIAQSMHGAVITQSMHHAVIAQRMHDAMPSSQRAGTKTMICKHKSQLEACMV
jgi:hypothetical protein